MTFLTTLIMSSGIAQVHDQVMNYIENKKYTNEPRVEVVLDLNRHKIESDLLKDLETGLLYGVKNTHLDNDARLMFLDASRSYDEGILSQIAARSRKGPHYVVSCKVADLTFTDSDSGEGGSYVFKGIIKGTDVVNGTVLFYQEINLKGKSKVLREFSYFHTTSDMSQAIAKKIRETTNELVKTNFPKANYVMDIEEIDKEKAKVISGLLSNHMKQSNPKKVYAYIVDQEIEIDGIKNYTFLKIGEAKKPYKDSTKRNKIFYKVSKGEKEILAYFNEGKKIYLSTVELGDKN